MGGYHQTLPTGVYADGTAETMCWCGGAVVLVPVADIRAGRTAECMPGCTLDGPKMRYARGSGGKRRKPGTGPAA